MKKNLVILFCLASVHAFALLAGGGAGVGGALTFNGAPLNTPTFGDGSEIVSGSFDSFGNFIAVGVNPNDYYSDVIFNLDTNSFSVINGTVYSKGLVNGGTYPSLTTNIYSLLHNYVYATNGAVRIIVGTAPSFVGAQFASDVNGTINPAAASLYPAPYSVWAVQWSGDGGNTWNSSLQQSTTPVLISVYAGFIQPALATNLTVTSYVNPSTVGGTNDLTAQTVLVTTTKDARSAVNVGSANSIAANAVTLWAASPAVADVNLAGHGLVMNSVWENLTSGYNLIFRANGSDFATFTPAVVSGTAPSFVKLTKSGALLTFQLTAVDVPNIQYKTNLTVTGWTDLPSQTNSFASGFWFVTAPAITNAANCFFRAGIAGTNSVSAKVSVAAQFFAASLILTNASGARFAVSVNSTTNGLTFTPAP